jgi:hypothetical protein
LGSRRVVVSRRFDEHYRITLPRYLVPGIRSELLVLQNGVKLLQMTIDMKNAAVDTAEKASIPAFIICAVSLLYVAFPSWARQTASRSARGGYPTHTTTVSTTLLVDPST